MKPLQPSFILLVALLSWCLVVEADDHNQEFQRQELAEGLDVPWGMAFVSEQEILFTERSGRLGLLNIGSGRVHWITEVPGVSSAGQGGLLDVAVRRNYRPGDWIYFTYAKALARGQSATTLARARLQQMELTDWTDLLVTKSVARSGRHFGSRIAFDDSGHIYFSVGDRGHRPNGQDLMTHAGSVLRLKLDGSVPHDNPFVGRTDALPEIWSYGHRNPQGLAYDPATDRLWAIEHGPRGGDEVNLIRPGRNYGWPVISYGKEYWGPLSVGEGTSRPGMEQPVKYYVPSIAPGSLLVYSGKAFPAWRGNLFAGALAMQHLNQIVLDDKGKAVGEMRLLEDLDERIRCVLEGPNGYLYFSTDSGRIFRLMPTLHQ